MDIVFVNHWSDQHCANGVAAVAQTATTRNAHITWEDDKPKLSEILAVSIWPFNIYVIIGQIGIYFFAYKISIYFFNSQVLVVEIH